MVPVREHPGEIMLETKPPIAAADLCDCWASDLKSAKHKLVSIAFRDSRSYNSEQIAKSLQIVHNEVAEEAEGPGSAYRWRLTWKIRGSWSLSVCISRYRAEQVLCHVMPASSAVGPHVRFVLVAPWLRTSCMGAILPVKQHG